MPIINTGFKSVVNIAAKFITFFILKFNIIIKPLKTHNAFSTAFA